MAGKEYSVYMLGSNTICPICSGMAVMQRQEEIIKCVDCREKFSIKGIGHTERELICIHT